MRTKVKILQRNRLDVESKQKTGPKLMI